MKILLVGYGGESSGHGRYCNALLQGLRDIGEEASLHTVAAMPKTKALTLPVIRQIDRTVRAASNAFRSWRAVESALVDVVHFQLLTPLMDRWWVPYVNSVRVLTVHNVTQHERSMAAPPRFTARLLRAMHALIVHSEPNRAALAQQVPELAERIEVVPHGIWSTDLRSRTEARAALGIGTERPIVLFFGAIRRNKGLDRLLRAIAALRRRQGTEATVLVAGEPDRNGFEAYERLITELGISSLVVKHLGRIPEASVALYYGAADVLALPYDATFQAQSGVLFDAYAHRVPVVGTDVGSLGDTIRRDQTGVVVASQQADDFADGLSRLLADAELRKQISSRMSGLGSGTYSWKNVARLTRTVYGKATARRSSAVRGGG